MDSDDEYIDDGNSSIGTDEESTSSSDDNEMLVEESKKPLEPDQRRMLDDFEAEMKANLEQRAVNHQVQEGFQAPLNLNDDTEKSTRREDYFDTDSEEEVEDNDPAAKAQANLDSFYDPRMDSKDEEWVEKQRKKYQPAQRKSAKPKPLPNSDAVLSCPACFTTLCHDCQRHSTYKTQYRAMFTVNCKIDTSQRMKAPLKMNRSKSKKPTASSQLEEPTENTQEETFYPVRCTACDTHVAMYDNEEVFHFFNIVTSH